MKIFKKAAALVMCFAVAVSFGACGHVQGEDDVMYETETVKLIDDAWAGQDAEYGSEAERSLEELSHVGKQVQDISMDLFRAGITEGKNSMISPVSILMAMSMVENGAEGESLRQMEEVFGCSAADLSYWLKSWKNSLRTSDDTKMNVADSFWFRDIEGLEVKEDYLKDISFYFDAQAYKSPFDQSTVDEMNKWVSDNTYGMIDRITENITPQEMAIILNATAFEGAWEEPYEDYQAVPGEIFYAADGNNESAVMMYSREGIYLENQMMTGFKKPYKDGYSFVALLPREDVSLADCVENLDGDAFRSLMEGARSEKVNAVIPEFTSEYTLDRLIEIFADMGINDIFSPAAADLTGMAEAGGANLYVGDILHKTFIDVNRTGTRAAAVTKITVKATSFMPEKIYEVRLDRPFIYAILDDQANTPMFMGTTVSVAPAAE